MSINQKNMYHILLKDIDRLQQPLANLWAAAIILLFWSQTIVTKKWDVSSAKFWMLMSGWDRRLPLSGTPVMTSQTLIIGTVHFSPQMSVIIFSHVCDNCKKHISESGGFPWYQTWSYITIKEDRLLWTFLSFHKVLLKPLFSFWLRN